MTFARSRYALASLLTWACAAPAPLRHAAAANTEARSLPAPRQVRESAPPSVTAAPLPSPGRPCGAFDCLAFATPEAAFSYVLREKPRILAIGEAHAQAGTAGIRSSTRRFAEQLLPLLAGKAKHVVIELLIANCQPRTVSGVTEAQRPVTEQQAPTNQNQFLTLGKYAQRLGIEPEALAPSCAEYEQALSAGADSVSRLLTLVRDRTRASVQALLAIPGEETALVLTYGGALHNDLYPRVGQESWSFGPALAAASQGRYVELDLIVPEFVKDTEAWRNQPWFRAFDRERLSRDTLLYRAAPSSFALIFPKTEAAPEPGL